MKTPLLFIMALFAIGLSAQQSVFTNTDPQGHTASPCFIKYLGNNKVLTVYYDVDTTIGESWNYRPNSIDITVTNVNGGTDFSSNIIIDSGYQYLQVYDAGVCKDGGYYVYLCQQVIANYCGYEKIENVLVKLSSTGSLEWNSAIKAPTNTYVSGTHNVLQDEYHNFYMNQTDSRGLSLAKVNGQGYFVWGRILTFDTAKNPLFALVLTGDGGIFCLGKTEQDKMVALVNYDGSVRYAYRYRNSVYNFGNVVKKHSAGGFIAGGSMESMDFSLTRYRADGSISWDKKYNTGSFYSEVLDIAEMPDGSLLLAALIGNMHVIIKTDGNGNQPEVKIIHAFTQNTYFSYNPHLRILSEGNDFIITGLSQSLATAYRLSPYIFRGTSANDFCETLNYPPPIMADITSQNVLTHDISSLTIENYDIDNSADVRVKPVVMALNSQNYCAVVTTVDEAEGGLGIAGDLNLVPNPASNHVTLTTSFSEGQLQVFNTTGIKVMEEALTQTQTTLSIDHLSAGVYLIKAMNMAKTQSIVKKLVKQ